MFVVVVGLVVVVLVGHRDLTLKFGQNWFNNKSYIIVVVVLIVLICCIFCFLLLFKVLSKLGQ